MIVNGQPLEVLLPQIPTEGRAEFARAVLEQACPQLVQSFATLPPEVRARSVLFLSIVTHSREIRLAEAARQAGWTPILVTLNQPKFNVRDHFHIAHVVQNHLLLMLAQWLFPGPIVHLFTPFGDQAALYLTYKTKPVILDIYDPCSEFKNEPIQRHMLERWCIANADGFVYRDLRIRYLIRQRGYERPRRSIFLHDPLWHLPEGIEPHRKPHTPGEIHVVSIGWVGGGDCSMLRVFQILSAHQIHVHLYFNLHQFQGHPDATDYYRLQYMTPYFHIEDQVYDDDYWRMLTRYDYGTAVTDRLAMEEPFDNIAPEAIEGCGSSRVADFISAGIGVIHHPGQRFQHSLARRYGTGVVNADASFFRDPRSVLQRAMNNQFEYSLDRFSAVDIQGVSQRLGEFYQCMASQA